MRIVTLFSLIALTLSLAACGGTSGHGGGDADPIGPDPIVPDPIVPPIEPESQTVSLPAASDLTGNAFDNGTTNAGGAPNVGDFAGNEQVVGIVGFDLSSLPTGAIVEEATLRVVQTATFGDAYLDFVNILVDHVRIGNLDSGANGFAGFNVTLNIATLAGVTSNAANGIENGVKLLDVTAQVQEELEEGSGLAQFRMRAQIPTLDFAQDEVRFAGASQGTQAPHLEITYRLP